MNPAVYTGKSRDAGDIRNLECTCFSDPWSPALITDMLDNCFDRVYLLREQPSDMPAAGYANLRITADEGEILRICIQPEYRGKGLSRLLMQKMIEEARINGVKRLLLEVRASNEAAIGLYRSFGFQKIALRKNYYSAPEEDAVIMEKQPV